MPILSKILDEKKISDSQDIEEYPQFFNVS